MHLDCSRSQSLEFIGNGFGHRSVNDLGIQGDSPFDVCPLERDKRVTQAWVELIVGTFQFRIIPAQV
jgi:hypothetical protein